MSTLLLHSVSYAGLWGQAYLSVDDVVAKARELGFGGVMLMAKRPHVSILDYGQRERDGSSRREHPAMRPPGGDLAEAREDHAFDDRPACLDAAAGARTKPVEPRCPPEVAETP